MELSLISSNDKKLREFRRFGLTDLNIRKGLDLKEVESDPLTVIKYKSKEAGPGTIVEDTSLHVDGEDVGSNIRWFLDKLGEYQGKCAVWEVMLAVNDGVSINIYNGVIKGTICSNPDIDTSNVFGFDPFFIPEGSTNTLAVLDLDGLKDNYSARKNAVDNLVSNYLFDSVKLESLVDWCGTYQNEGIHP